MPQGRMPSLPPPCSPERRQGPRARNSASPRLPERLRRLGSIPWQPCGRFPHPSRQSRPGFAIRRSCLACPGEHVQRPCPAQVDRLGLPFASPRDFGLEKSASRPSTGAQGSNSEFQWVKRRGQDNASARGQRPRSEPILLCISGPAFIWRLTGCVARMRRECKTTPLPCSPPARGCIPLIEPRLGAGGACDTTRFILWG
jgi:hypothetical protein